MCLDPALLNEMARQDMALTPTLSTLQDGAGRLAERPDSPRKTWLLEGIQAHPSLVAAAAEAGVTLLAGTDSRPTGRIADEVRALAMAGVKPHDALAAASWTARSYLGLPGLRPEAPADAVIYDEDPRSNLDVLDHPVAVILRGRRLR
jgi:imidazolonepropionase-like amidohydrolase